MATAVDSMNNSAALCFELRDEFIPLHDLLKAVGVATSGGAAKAMVAAGQVQVDGLLEMRKRCKIRAGQVVTVGGASITVSARGAPAATA